MRVSCLLTLIFVVVMLLGLVGLGLYNLNTIRSN
jgi:hypothetical protein